MATVTDTLEEQLKLAGVLMAQATRAAIIVIESDDDPHIAADLLRLARDRWESAWSAQSDSGMHATGEDARVGS